MVGVANELDRLIGEEKKSASWIKKHLKRDIWLKKNFRSKSSLCKFPTDSFEIISIFLTAFEIPSMCIQEMPLPCIPFSRLKREGVKILDELQKYICIYEEAPARPAIPGYS